MSEGERRNDYGGTYVRLPTLYIEVEVGVTSGAMSVKAPRSNVRLIYA